MCLPQDRYNDITNRVGYWELSLTGEEEATWKLDIDAFVTGVQQEMWQIEEDVTRKVVVAKLRELGYIIIEPEEDQ